VIRAVAVVDEATLECVADFVSAALFDAPGRIKDCSAIAVLDGERLIAAVVYKNWDRESGVIEMMTAAVDRRWLTRPVLRALFAYPFDQLGCQMCVLRISECNAPMLRIAKAVGFKEFIIPRLRGRDEAEHILTLTDDDWRAGRFHRTR
jgi:RimJ/RimL family protein N-acetyltransferase